VPNLESLKIIPGNRGTVRFIERIWLLWEEGRPLCGVVIKARQKEAYFTVGARKGHTFLYCDRTRPAVGWKRQAKLLHKTSWLSEDIPWELCPWGVQHGDRKVKGCYRAVRPFGQAGEGEISPQATGLNRGSENASASGEAGGRST